MDDMYKPQFGDMIQQVYDQIIKDKTDVKKVK